MRDYCWCLAACLILVARKVEALEGDDQSASVSVSYNEESEEWKVDKGLKDFASYSDVLAVANLTNSQTQTGWMYLEVKTREDANDVMQAKAAGVAEGYLTRKSILEYYKEFYAKDFCKKDPPACDWLKGRFKRNTDYALRRVRELRASEPYWHMVGLFYEQMEGINIGFKMKSAEGGLSDEGMDNDQGVHLLNFIADFWDMSEQYKLLKKKNNLGGSASKPSCSVIFKHLPETGDVLMAHNTWHEYRAMSFRFLKNYNLNYHTLPDQTTLVPGHTISMSSYAGSVFSVDDFYLSSSGLAATETTLFVYNKDLLRNLKVEGVIMEPIRVMAANRLAESGKAWTDIVAKENSGTYNNEWMVLDYNLVGPTLPQSGVLTVLEQLPGKVVSDDQTKVLRDESYWASYNRAFYPEIFRLSGAPSLVEQFGDWFTHDRTPRAKIFRRDHDKIRDLPSLMTLMRYNDFKQDEFAVVSGCDPPRTPAGAIANRLDLSPPGANCSFAEYDWMVGHSGYGALDAKLASKSSFPSLSFMSVGGTTHGGPGNLPPFQWSNTTIDGIPAYRPIDRFDFTPENHTWELNVVTGTGSTVHAGHPFAVFILAYAAYVLLT